MPCSSSIVTFWARPLPWLDQVERAKQPVRLPVVLSRAEIALVLGQLNGTPWLVAALLYGSGLRLLAACRLRIKDIDFDARVILVRDGKGRKDRRTVLPRHLMVPLATQRDCVEAMLRADQSPRAAHVKRPDALMDDRDTWIVTRRGNGERTLPGGTRAGAETWDVTLQREILEETGCVIECYAPFGAFRVDDGRRTSYRIVTLAAVRHVQLPADPDGTRGIVEVAEVAFEVTRSMVRSIRSDMEIQYEQSSLVSNAELNALWSVAWPGHESRDFASVLIRSLVYIVARHEGRVIGFVNVVWDGDEHGFLLDPTVDPAYRRRRIGTELVRHAAAVARARDLRWLHVDFVPDLAEFYSKLGFRPTAAGLMQLQADR